MNTRRNFLKGGAAAALGAAMVSRAQAASLPEAPIQKSSATQAPLAPPNGRPYNPVVTLNGWTPAVADEQRVEGVPPDRRAGGARDGARHEGESLGLQRPVARPDDRVRGGRQAAHLRHQQAPRAHHDPLARHPAAERHGRRGRAQPAADPGREDLRLRVHADEVRHLHVPPTRRRDGADGDGHDGLHRRAPERPGVHARRPRFLLPHQRVRYRSGELHA